MKIAKRSKWGDAALGLIVPLLLVLFWEIACRLELFPPQIVIPPRLVLATFLELLRSGELADNLKISLIRVLLGFVLGTVSGFLLGAGMAISRPVERYLLPLFTGIRQVPVLGWIPLLMIWLGIGETFKVVFISLGAFYPMTVNTFDGFRGVPVCYVEVARAFGFRRRKLLLRVLLPAALPSIFTGIRIALNMSWMLVIAAELVAAGEGIGYTITWGRQLFQMDIVIMGVILIGLIGYGMNHLVGSAEAASLHWRRPFQAK
ncbi:MAG TPA: ABC transporter permease [Candidatus Deferrimicrobiaceae bacterium]